MRLRQRQKALRPASASASGVRSGRNNDPGHIRHNNAYYSSRTKGKRNQDVALVRQSRTNLRHVFTQQPMKPMRPMRPGHDTGTVPLAWGKANAVTERLVKVGMDSVTSLPSEFLDLELSSPSVWDEMRALKSK